jgi:probable FeS assembly SUF system protein SufT
MIHTHAREELTLTRDVHGTEIPSGEPVVLPKGQPVTLTQSLGGAYTILTEFGRMVRIDGKDGDSLGEQYAQAAKESAAPVPDGPFEEAKVWDQLKTVYDPEIPVNIVDLGLVYFCKAAELPEGGHKVEIKMTMTAPGCGMGGIIRDDVVRKVMTVPGVKEADVELVWDPPWDQSRMTDVAKLQLGWI